MEMTVNEVFGLAGAILLLAGISFAIANGGSTAAIMGAGFNGFGNLVKAATFQK